MYIIYEIRKPVKGISICLSFGILEDIKKLQCLSEDKIVPDVQTKTRHSTERIKRSS